MTAGKILRSLNIHNGQPITTAVFSPAEFIMATAAADNAINVVDLQSFDTLQNFPFENTPHSLTFEEDEGKVICASFPDSLKVRFSLEN